MSDNFNIFDYMFEKYKITKPIRLIELFAGYGSQALALDYLGANYEKYKCCEWAVKSIQAYKDIHYPDDNTDYSIIYNDEQIFNLLYGFYGISMDYNKPMTLEQIKRKGIEWARQVYNNIIATNNLVNIQKVKGGVLEINQQEKYQYLMTYSFPCQDLSL